MAELLRSSALQDFRRAQYKADLNCIIEFLQHRPISIFSYDDTYKRLHTRHSAHRPVTQIPLDAISGSVSHYDDFRQAFLPQKQRNASYKDLLEPLPEAGEEELPPVELYQIGTSYFVSDGNHRVLLARQFGATVIDAFVTTIAPPQNVTWINEPKEIILHAEAASFFNRTRLRESRPELRMTVTMPGKFHILSDQIAVCHAVLSEQQRREVSFEEAACYWHDEIYAPTLAIIEPRHLLRDFPERTATDLYIWVSDHREIFRQSSPLSSLPDAAPPSASDSIQATEQQLQAEYDDFMRRTQLRVFRPDADVRFTTPGKYRVLDEHIQGHGYFLWLEQRRYIPYYEAVTHWYDTVYLPIVNVIASQHLVDDFPVYTITDLYIWISEHQLQSRQGAGSPHAAYLQEIWVKLQNFPYEDFYELLIKMEYIDFLLHTRLHELRPNAELTLTTPGQYRALEQHIEVHRYFMGIEQRREIPYSEAVQHWYDAVYLPVLAVADEFQLTREFPNLTAADLYLWVSEHRSRLERQAGDRLPLERVVQDLVSRFGAQKSSPVSRKKTERIEMLDNGEEDVSQQQKRDLADRRKHHLISTLFTPVSGAKEGWAAVEQALVIAQQEDAHLLAAHLVPSEHLRDSDRIVILRSQFEQRCQAADVRGTFQVEVGETTAILTHIGQQAELLLLPIYEETSRAEIAYEMNEIARSCSAPLLLTLPAQPCTLRHALLLYNGSSKSNEALFVSAYLASNWECDLEILLTTRDPLLRSFIAQYVSRRNLRATILRNTIDEHEKTLPELLREHQRDFVIVGSSEALPVIKTVSLPILIC